MPRSHDPSLTYSDVVVWKNLMYDIDKKENLSSRSGDRDDLSTSKLLDDVNNPKAARFQPTVFTSWDQSDTLPTVLRYIVEPYVDWARRVVRTPTDVVFLTHILLYTSTSVPSAVRLFFHFTWTHGVFHWLMTSYYCGAFTIMLHNHIHNNGVLASNLAFVDRLWPYLLEPLMGHTWDSYYYHHVKHHHVENNGPGDLSSTIWFQRDDLLHLMYYIGRFLFFIWFELPLYFHRKGKRSLAIKCAISELGTYAFIYLAARCNLRATMFVFLIPLLQMRIGMMVGNWGQHALVDEEEPDSDFRSSITLIDVPVSIYDSPLHASESITPTSRQFTASSTSASHFADQRSLV
ncbi:uncharacterized protein KY384_002553 [Bacidia gigantensis]|uniref:uncharacterized protein n=1 Tax=Bacidia gigantensis TaxID=2732470 RepID=UPI001D03E592|nr:uncharacterized protein KY384_002553 [Bacidia gigantensis]KAG8532676.1 hypothetical protein KY384_002553 [Bacidia gigantensis]